MDGWIDYIAAAVFTVLSAGLFDECLKERPELGSDMISNAQLQYQATVALHSRKVCSTGLYRNRAFIIPGY